MEISTKNQDVWKNAGAEGPFPGDDEFPEFPSGTSRFKILPTDHDALL